MSRLAFLRNRRLRRLGAVAALVLSALLLFVAPWSSHDSLAPFLVPDADLVLHVPDSDRLYRRLGEHPLARHVLDHPRRDVLVRDILSLSTATLRALADLHPERDGAAAIAPDPRRFAGEVLASARLAPGPPPSRPRAGVSARPPFPMESLLVALRPYAWSLPTSLRLVFRDAIFRRLVLPALPPDWGASFDDGILSIADAAAVLGAESFATSRPPSGLHVAVSRDVILLATNRAELVAARERKEAHADGVRLDPEADVTCRLGPGVSRWRERIARSALGEDVATY